MSHMGAGSSLSRKGAGSSLSRLGDNSSLNRKGAASSLNRKGADSSLSRMGSNSSVSYIDDGSLSRRMSAGSSLSQMGGGPPASRLCVSSSLINKQLGGGHSSFGRMTAILENGASYTLHLGAVMEGESLPKETEPEKLIRFWKDILDILRTGNDESQLHNIARLNYEVKIGNIPESLTDPDIKVCFTNIHNRRMRKKDRYAHLFKYFADTIFLKFQITSNALQ